MLCLVLNVLTLHWQVSQAEYALAGSLESGDKGKARSAESCGLRGGLSARAGAGSRDAGRQRCGCVCCPKMVGREQVQPKGHH